MLIPATYLVDRLRHPRSRADELAAVRRRLAAQPGPDAVSAEELASARELAALRRELAAAFDRVDACGGCARGYPMPHGRYSGGQCCGGRTEGVFTDAELAALRLSGTTPDRLRPPPPSDHAGCAFRGPEGCSLRVADRPNLCVRYVCRELEAELRARGELARVRVIASALARAARRFEQLRDVEMRRRAL